MMLRPYARKRPDAGPYRDGYLKSSAWWRRRAAWFTRRAAAGSMCCAVCAQAGTTRTLDLRHVDYTGVVGSAEAGWTAGEEDRDLVALCRSCHDTVHELLDRDRAYNAARTRRAANQRVLTALRRKHTHHEKDTP